MTARTLPRAVKANDSSTCVVIRFTVNISNAGNNTTRLIIHLLVAVDYASVEKEEESWKLE